MKEILSLLTGGLAPIMAAIGGMILVAWRIYAAGQKSGSNQEKVKANDAYETHLKDLAAAADAGNRVDPVGLPGDPYNRDRKPKG